MPVELNYKILFLPKWYPNRTNSLHGIFIENHAKVIAKHCKTAVLFVGGDSSMESKRETVISKEEGLTVVRVYYKNSDWGDSLLGKTIKLWRYLSASYAGLKCIKKEFGKPHLVHVNVLTRNGIVAYLLKFFQKIPYIITEHWSGYMPADGSYKGFIKKSITKKVVRHAYCITTVSEHLATAMLAHQLSGNYFKIGNVITVPEKLKTKPNSAKIQALMVGNLFDREKNISLVINAIAKLKDEIPQLHLKIIGEGADRMKLEYLVTELELSDKIEFTGTLEHSVVLDEIAAASFVIVNSNYETFSVVAAESLACGTPVLCSRCGGPEEFINSENGWLIACNHADELKSGIEKMCKNFSSYNQKVLQKSITDNFSEEVIAGKFLKIYNELIHQWEAGNTRTLLNIPYQWRVLDVGSGDHPNERADVLLEREMEETEHRSGAKAVIPEGKDLVLGDATAMPFSDKQFDFLIASHIAEHIDDPEAFCKEIQRVSKSGYIETPGSFSELIFCEAFHKWIVTQENGRLIFTEKKQIKVLSEFFYRLYYLNEKRSGHLPIYSNNKLIIKLVNALRRFWKYLPNTYTRFHWKESFEFRVIRK